MTVDFNKIVSDHAGAALAVAPPAQGPWSHCNQASLGFDGGSLLIKPDGSGWFAFNEREIDWEQDDESGASILVAKFAAGEAQELRDYLNKWFPAQGMEARQGGDANTAPSRSDDSPVLEEDAPVTTRQNISDVLIEALERLVESADSTAWSSNTNAMDAAINEARDALRQAKGEGR